jgi:drug/metabolite transporter (DMT)-like permease
MSNLAKGYVIAVTGIILWSTTGVFIGYLITHYKMPALLLAFWRDLLVCVALVPALLLTRRSLLHIPVSHIGYYILFGLTLALFNSIWVVSVKTNGAAVATVLVYSSAGFTAALAWWFLRETLGLPKIAAIILSLCGCVLVSNAYNQEMWKLNPLGASTGLLSGLLFAVYNLFCKEAARRKTNPWTTMLYSFAFGSIFIMIFNLFPILPDAAGSFKALLPKLPISGWFVLVVLSFVPTVLGFGFYNTSMKYLPASIVSLLATSEPVMTAVEAYIFLDERMTIIQIAGGLIILSAVLVVQLEKEQSGYSERC